MLCAAMPQLTYRLTSDDPPIYRVSFDGVEIGSIVQRTRHAEPIKTSGIGASASRR